MSADDSKNELSETSSGEYEALETGEGSYEFVVDSEANDSAADEGRPDTADREASNEPSDSPQTPIVAIVVGTLFIAAAGIAVVYWTMGSDETDRTAETEGERVEQQGDNGFRPYQGDDQPAPSAGESQVANQEPANESDADSADAEQRSKSTKTEIIVLEEDYDEEPTDEQVADGELVEPERLEQNQRKSIPIKPGAVRKIRRNIELKAPPGQLKRFKLPHAKNQPVRERNGADEGENADGEMVEEPTGDGDDLPEDDEPE